MTISDAETKTTTAAALLRLRFREPSERFSVRQVTSRLEGVSSLVRAGAFQVLWRQAQNFVELSERDNGGQVNPGERIEALEAAIAGSLRAAGQLRVRKLSYASPLELIVEVYGVKVQIGYLHAFFVAAIPLAKGSLSLHNEFQRSKVVRATSKRDVAL